MGKDDKLSECRKKRRIKPMKHYWRQESGTFPFPVSAWLPFSQPSWLGYEKDKNRRREQQNRLIVGRKG